MIHRSDILNLMKTGERVLVTFYDGEGSLISAAGKILRLIEEAILFRVRSGREVDRTLVIYLHRIVSLKRASGSRHVS